MKVLLLLCAFVVLAVARPRSRVPTRFLERLLRLQKQVRDEVTGVSDEACGVALSNAIGEVLDHITDIPNAPPVIHMKGKLKELSVRVLGFDIFDDEKARVKALCKVSDANSVAGLKIAMRDYDYNLFRLAYDYVAIVIPMGSQNVSPPQQAIMRIMESLGLTSLDPEGVDWCLETSGMRDVYEILTAGYVPAPPSGGDLAQKCLILQEVAAQYIGSLGSYAPAMAAMISENIRQWTGIDIHDDEQISTLLCDLLAAAEEGLESVYDVIDGYGIMDQVYRTGYPLAADGARMAKQQLSGLLEMLESIANTIPTGNAPPVMPPPGNYDFLNTNELPGPHSAYPSYGDYPFNDGSYYGGPPYGGPPHHGKHPHGNMPPNGGPSYGGPPHHSELPHGMPHGGPPHGGPPHGGPPNGGPPHGGPPHGGPPPGHGGPNPTALLGLIRATVKLLDALEVSGLLSLA